MYLQVTLEYGVFALSVTCGYLLSPVQCVSECKSSLLQILLTAKIPTPFQKRPLQK